MYVDSAIDDVLDAGSLRTCMIVCMLRVTMQIAKFELYVDNAVRRVRS